MATYEQLVDAARRADAANDGTAAKRFLELARDAKPQAAPEVGPIEATAEQFGQGAISGMAGLAGLPAELFSGAYNLGQKAVGSVDRMSDPVLGGDFMRERATDMGLLRDNEPEGMTQRLARTVGEYAGPAAATAASGGLGALAMGTGAGAASGLAGGAVREGGGGPVAEAIAALMAGGGAAAGMGRYAKGRAAVNAVPTSDELKGTAGGLYRQGEATGRTASTRYTKSLQAEVEAIAKQQSAVLPSGGINAAYPKLKHALDMVGEFSGRKMDPKEMRVVRKAVADAAQSADPQEARIGTMMLKKVDEFIDPLVPEYKQANATYAKAKRGDEIDETIAIAGTRPQSTSNAIRNEFSNLQRSEIRGDMTFPPELVAAVEKAAKGGQGRRIAEGIGNVAPTPWNMTRAGLGLGGITAGGGPVMGAAAGAGSLMSRLLANRLAKGDARVASAIARNGGPLSVPPETAEQVRQALMAMLLSSTAQPLSQ